MRIHAFRNILAVAAFVMIGVAAKTSAGLESDLQKTLSGKNLGTTDVGISVVDLTAGDRGSLASINAEKPLIPASNMKLITTAAALSTLGPDFRFRTKLLFIESENDDAGDLLIVKGDGDPAFCDRKLLRQFDLTFEDVLKRWVQAVKDTETTHIKSLLIDDRVFDDNFVHEDWPEDQLHRSYCAQVTGLNFYNNTFDVTPQPTRFGEVPLVTVIPMVEGVTTTNRAATGQSDTFDLHRRPGTNHLTFMGKVKTVRTIPLEVTMHDPPMVFGEVLAERLRKVGIKVDEVRRPTRQDPVNSGKMIQQYVTTLPAILARTNKDSENLFAEALLKRVGNKYTGSPGSWDNGSAAARDFLRRQIGTSSVIVRCDDGSGMSRENRVTARMLVRLLGVMHKWDENAVEKAKANKSEPKRYFRDSLAIAGVDGTLENRLAKGLVGEFHGKSGYINQVTTLSGYLVYHVPVEGTQETKEHVVALSLLFNNYESPIYHADIKGVQDELVRLIDQNVARDLGLIDQDREEVKSDPLAVE